jgi:hypothetical protein
MSKRLLRVLFGAMALVCVARAAMAQPNPYAAQITTQTGTTYTTQQSDCGTTVNLTSPTAVTVTLAPTINIGCPISLTASGGSVVTVAPGAGASLNSASTATTIQPATSISLIVTANPGGASAIWQTTANPIPPTLVATGGLIVNGARPARQTDDSVVPFVIGNSWSSPSGQVFQSQDVTAGFAMWQQVQSSVLPGDVIGLNVSAASYTSGGASCVANEVLTFTGGMQVKVTVCTAGVPSTYSITQSRMHACTPATPTAISPLATTGGDGSSVWNLTVQSPVAMYGTRLLTRCWAGKALNVVRSDTNEAADIGFLPDGSLDTKTLDGFVGANQPMAQYATYAAGVNPRLDTWYDQSGTGNNATQSTVADQPTIFPGRQIGNSRSVMFDSWNNSGTLWMPTGPIFLTLPSGVALAGNNSTVAVLGGVAGDQDQASFFHLGTHGAVGLLVYSNVGAGGGAGCANNTSNKVGVGGAPDEGTLMLCVNSSGGTTFSSGQFSAAGAAGSSSTFAGDTLGRNWANAQSYPIDEAMVLAVPWVLTATEQSALQASVAATFGTTPQKRGVIVAVGDSHIDVWGSPYEQPPLRQAMSLLGRPDISYVNAALAGSNISSFVGSYTLNSIVLPTFGEYAGNKYLYIEGGYNDIVTGQTVAQVEATFTSLSASAHTSGAKVICDTNVIRDATLTINQQVEQVSAWERTTPSVCDYVFDPQIFSGFAALSGPWPLPWFEQQDTGIHLTAAGNALRGSMLANFLQTNGLFN